ESSMTAMLLPVGLRRFFRTSNHIERLNRELKRRSKVIGIFPNEEYILRRMGSVLIEEHEAMSLGRAVYSPNTLSALMNSEVPKKLIAIANEQQQFRAA
ncbi:MAG: transposase, partial [Oscillospiraceae bacterium]|nr:transposase [Oscillospiraceae bacterium]